MRLFVAVRPPAEALAHAASAVAAVRAAHEGPRWIPAERWHLTLAFYGELPDAEVGKVVDRLDRRLPRHCRPVARAGRRRGIQPARGVAGSHR